MTKCKFLFAAFLCPLLFACGATAQPLPKIELHQVYPNLQIDRPIWMSEAPDGSGRLFFVQQSGIIYIVKKGSDGGDAKEFFNIENRHPYFWNEDGLLSIAFHPGFRTNGLFYVYYNQQNNAERRAQLDNFPYRSVISEFKVSGTNADRADMASERILFEVGQPYPNHKGGQLSFGPDGYLYLALGDGGSAGDPLNNGQNLSTLLAKMLRIDVNTRAANLQYGIPSDNPLAKIGGTTRPEIFAFGLRNAWRYSFDRKTGDLWAGDVGQDLWEEVDIVTNGGNYGWSIREGMHHFKDGPDGVHYAEPVMEYAHKTTDQPDGMFPDHATGICIIGGYVYRGKKYPALDGIYIYADYSPGNIFGLRYDRAAHKVTDEATLLRQPKSITSFAEDLDGELYAFTQDGYIYSITAP